MDLSLVSHPCLAPKYLFLRGGVLRRAVEVGQYNGGNCPNGPNGGRETKE